MTLQSGYWGEDAFDSVWCIPFYRIFDDIPVLLEVGSKELAKKTALKYYEGLKAVAEERGLIMRDILNWHETVFKVIRNIKETSNPAIKANRLSQYLNDLLKKQEITIYEAYLLQGQIINYLRDWYKQPAWGGWVQISTCLEIINQRLLAVVFKDADYAKTLKEWGREAFRLCEEKRAHYITDRFEDFINIDENADVLLQELLDVRKKYARLSVAKGPYHVEVFPFHYFEPEKILLEKTDITTEKNISKDIETILVELKKEHIEGFVEDVLDYSIKNIDEKILEIKREVKNNPNYADSIIDMALQKCKEAPDVIAKYDTLMGAYITCGESFLIANNDTAKFKSYYYLAAKAGENCFRLAERGHKTQKLALNVNLRTKRNIFYYARYAILADMWDLAIRLVSEDSLLGAILMKDYERAKQYIPKDFKDIPKSDELKQELWTIVYLDEKKLNSLLEKNIKELRRQARSFSAVYFACDELALVKLAIARGMSCNLNVVELPIHLLDDVKIKEDEWTLPEDKELEELLK